MASDLDEEASISIPSIAFVTIVGFLIYRYFFSSSSSSTSSTPSSSRSSARYTAAQVDNVAQMFPQLSRRDIMWDLHQNRGNVQMTTDKVLRVGRLESAPQTFQPPALPQTSNSTLQSPTGSSVPSSATKSAVEPDLITRYNLQSRVGTSDKGKEKEVVVVNENETSGGAVETESQGQANHGWANTKDERQAMLKRRRDEMILAARRKMQERVARGEGIAE